MKTIYSIITLLVFTIFTSAQAQKTTVNYAYTTNGLELRWQPTFEIWYTNLSLGYRVERSSDNGKTYTPITNQPKLNRFIETRKPLSFSDTLLQRMLASTEKLTAVYQEDTGEIVLNNFANYYNYTLLSSKGNLINSGLYLVDKEVTLNNKYIYRIYEKSNNTRIAEITTFTLKPKKEAFAAKAENKMQEVTLKWPATKNAKSYSISRKENEAIKVNLLAIPNPILEEDRVKDLVFIDSVPKLNSTYTYTITHLDELRNEIGSTQVSLTVLDKTPPTGVSSFSVKKGATKKQVELTWENKNIEPDFAGYKVYKSLNPNEKFEQINKTLLPPSLTYFNAALGENEYQAYYQIGVVDKNGNEQKSLPKIIVFDDKDAPNIPKGLQAVVSKSGVVSLTWDANTENDLAGYRVFASRTGKTDFIAINQQASLKTILYDTLALNFKNPKYYYKICALDINGNSSQLSKAVAISLPDTIAPIKPILQKPILKDGILILKWTPELNSNIAAHKLYSKEVNTTENWTKIANVLAAQGDSIKLTYKGESTLFAVQSIDSSGNASPFSNTRLFAVNNADMVLPVEKITTEKEENQTTISWNYPIEKPIRFLVFEVTPNQNDFNLVSNSTERKIVLKNEEDKSVKTFFIIAQNEAGVRSAASKTVTVLL